MEIEIISSVIVIICTKQDCLLLPKFFGCLPSGHSDGTIFSLVECYVESKGKRNVAELYILLFCFFPQCSVTCGRGYQQRVVQCITGTYGVSVVDVNVCSTAARPTEVQVSLLCSTPLLALGTEMPKLPSGSFHRQVFHR